MRVSAAARLMSLPGNPEPKAGPVIVSPSVKLLVRAFLAALVAGALMAPARAGNQALLLIDAESGKVLQAENATYPWYPASTSKLMTTYVTLKAVKDGRITFDTLFTVSPNAVAQTPSKMGFRTGTQVTVDNALKMLLVHSANDIAVVLAEGIDGSIEKFADEMNATSQQLGMTQSSWVNPNGLPAEGQISSARDLGILARALMHDFPEYDFYWHIPSIKFGKRIMRNYNKLLAEYPGADGMKTGFICSSGFNLVASATRGNRRLIAVVLGAPSSAVRATKAAALLEHGFGGNVLSWLMPTLGTVDKLQPINAAPPDLHDQVCGPHRKRPAAEDEDDDTTTSADNDDPHYAFMLSDLKGATRGSLLTGNPLAAVPPIVVYVGPKRAAATASTEDDAAIPAAKKRKHAKKTDPKQADAKAPGATSTGTKPTGAKSGETKSTDAKKTDAKKTDAKAAAAKIISAKPKAAPTPQ
jgi:D-alanyl-D-alanine carboxypeptidase